MTTKIIVTKGIPGSGKSTWAKDEIAKDPLNSLRINNDEIRAMVNGSVWSLGYENIITSTRLFLIREALKRDIKTIIVDNVNADSKHWDDVCKIAKDANRDIWVTEKPFFVELETAIERDSQRTGSAKVGEEVIRRFWKKLGGKQFAHYNPKTESFSRRTTPAPDNFVPAVQNPNAPKAIICDLDGTISLLNGRNPYDATHCDQDLPNLPVVKTIQLYHQQGYQIIFCSGREDKYRAPTERFLAQHLSDVPYHLFMRQTSDLRKDSIIKEEIYQAHIKDKFNVLLVLDDRNQVVSLWRSLGLVCWQVAEGDF